MAKHRFGLAVLVSTFLLFSPAAKAGIVTLDIFGFGTGLYNATSFTDQYFNFHLEGPDGGNNAGIALTTSTVQIIGVANSQPLSFTFPTLANLDVAGEFAFLRPNTNNGGVSDGSDLVRLFFSSAQFLVLNSSNLFFDFSQYATFPGFQNIAVTGGNLTFTSATDFVDGEGGPLLLAQSSGFTSAVPEPATWAMMILGFAGLAMVAYRRSRKFAAVAST